MVQNICIFKAVPGIGEKTEEKLNEVGIHTTYQLIGQFLMFKKMPDMTEQQIKDAFWFWLRDTAKINQYRSGIVYALSEKISILFPDILG